MKNYNQTTVKGKIIADLTMIAVIVFSLQYDPNNAERLFSNNNIIIVLVCLATWVISARAMGVYNDFRDKQFSIEWIAFLKGLGVYALVSSFLFLQLLSNFSFERSMLIWQCVYIFLALPIQKVTFRIVIKMFLRNNDQYTRKVLIVGAGSNGLDFYQQYVERENYGFKLAGFIDEEKNTSLNGHYLGKISEIDRVIEKHELDDIVVTGATDESMLRQIVAVGEKQGKRVRIIPDYQRFGPRKVQIDRLGSLPIITLRSLPLDLIDNKLLKRSFDIVFSLLTIALVFSWLFPVIALLIKLTSKGPVLFKQERWGLNNKPIICYKFRSMVNTSRDLDENGKYQQATRNDPRVTRIGAFLRQTNLDELPQLFNVLMGSMSLVGPRPHPVPLNLLSKDSIENYMMRHWVKPGITGWAQINGYRGETRNPYLMKKRVESDVWYIENWTFWLDLQIILQTVVNMVKGEENAF